MTKKITLLFVICLIWGCGYQPIYLKKNNSEQGIKTIILNGEQKINKTNTNTIADKYSKKELSNI